jgi:hypothetical protein
MSKNEENMNEEQPYDGPRRLFTKTTVDKEGNEKSHPSAVLRAKKDESQEEATARLTKMGWNMDAPHKFEDGVFRTTDPKRKKKKKKNSADTPEDEKTDDKPDEAKADKTPEKDEKAEESSEESSE